MRIRSYWRTHPDLYEQAQKNLLYELVKVYGAFLEFKSTGDPLEGFAAYFSIHRVSKYHYHTIAHSEFQKYYFENHHFFIPKNAMKKLICTSKNRFVYTYDWLPVYLDYFVSEIEKEPVLVEFLENNIFLQCENCNNVAEDDREKRYNYCSQKLLGFQFDFLFKLTASENTKHKRVAKDIFGKIRNCNSVGRIAQICLETKKER